MDFFILCKRSGEFWLLHPETHFSLPGLPNASDVCANWLGVSRLRREAFVGREIFLTFFNTRRSVLTIKMASQHFLQDVTRLTYITLAKKKKKRNLSLSPSSSKTGGELCVFCLLDGSLFSTNLRRWDFITMRFICKWVAAIIVAVEMVNTRNNVVVA